MMTLQQRWIWYKNLKWWEKILAALPFVLVLVFLVCAIFFRIPISTPSENSDQAETNVVNTVVANAEARDKELAAKIDSSVKEIDKLNAQAKVTDGKAADAKAAIRNAKSFEEIDAIRNKLYQ